MSFLKSKNITPLLTYPRVDFSAVGGYVGNQKTEVPSPSLFPWYLELGSHCTDSFRNLKLLFKTCGDSVGNPMLQGTFLKGLFMLFNPLKELRRLLRRLQL